MEMRKTAAKSVMMNELFTNEKKIRKLNRLS
jgi:hypothetical protein